MGNRLLRYNERLCSTCRALLLLVAVLCSHPATSAERLALVIGNSDYDQDGKVSPVSDSPENPAARWRYFSDLANPAADAAVITESLKTLGYTVLEYRDLDKQQLTDVLQSFTSLLEEKGSDTQAVLYFAGHGIQVENRHLLAPVGARLTKDPKPFYGESDEVLSDFISIDTFTFPKSDHEAGWTLVVLDACRENPWPSLAVRGIVDPVLPMGQDGSVRYLPVFGPGHSAIGPRGLVLLAAEPGQLASDGDDGNSPVARALAAELRSDQSIHETLTSVVNAVRSASKGRQVPHVYRGKALLPCSVECFSAVAGRVFQQPDPVPPAALFALAELGPAEVAWRVGALASNETVLQNTTRREVLLKDFASSPEGTLALDVWEYWEEGGHFASFAGTRSGNFAGNYVRRCSMVFLRERCPTDRYAEATGERSAEGGWVGVMDDALRGTRALGRSDAAAALVMGVRFLPEGSFELGYFAGGRLRNGIFWDAARMAWREVAEPGVVG